jgi:hypothetical protein
MCFGGSSGSSSSSTSTNSTSVTVNPTTTFNLDTADLANAITALAGAQAEGAVYTANTAAAAQVQAASITANAGPSLYEIGGAIIAILGLLLAAGIIKIPRGLQA